MRAVDFMKIDYVVTRQQSYLLPIFYILAVVIGGVQKSAMYACAYMLFIAVTFSGTPFNVAVKKEAGFLLLLPATVKDRVAGRFLFGLSYMAIAMGSGVISIVVLYAVGYTATPGMAAVMLLNLALANVLMTIEYMLYYIFGAGFFNSQYLMSFVRVIPGMAMFFTAIYCIGRIEEGTGGWILLEQVGERLVGLGAAAVAASLVFLLAAAAICVKVIEKRDYV